MRGFTGPGAAALALVVLGCWVPPSARWLDAYGGGIRTWCRPVAEAPFALHDGAFFQTGEGRQLRSRSAADGSTHWTLDFDDECVLTYAVRDGLIGVVLTRGGRRSSPTTSSVLGVDAREGRRRWIRRIDAYPLGGLPAIDGRAVYVATRRHRDAFLGRDQLELKAHRYDPDHRLRAFDAASGAPLWSQPVPTPEGYHPIYRLQILSDGRHLFLMTLFVEGARWTVSAYDAPSGLPLWIVPSDWAERRFTPPQELPLQIGLLSDGRLVHFRRGRIEVRDAQTGALLDAPQLTPEVQAVYESASSLLLHDDSLYLFSPHLDTAMRIELPGGTERWRRRFGERRDWKGITQGSLPLAYGEERLSVGAEDGNVYVLQAADGELVGYVDPTQNVGHGDAPAIPYAGGVLMRHGLLEMRSPWLRIF